MRLTYLGHATVLMEDAGHALITDPLLVRRVGHLLRHGERPPELPLLDGVLLTHLHHDHLHLPSLRLLPSGLPAVVPQAAAGLARRAGLEPVPLAAWDSVSVGPFEVRAVPADHAHSRLPWGRPEAALGFIVSRRSPNVYFAGDTGLFPEMWEIGDLGIGTALLPVAGWGPTLGPGHMGPDEAARSLRALRPDIAVPIHWGTFSPFGMGPRGDHAAQAFRSWAGRLAPEVRVEVLGPGEQLETATASAAARRP
jgi:L-ascorbate metabolism protein UlaG (beta-lactamase superfamily)